MHDADTQGGLVYGLAIPVLYSAHCSTRECVTSRSSTHDEDHMPECDGITRRAWHGPARARRM